MGKYPKVITPKVLATVAHLSDESIAADIDATEDDHTRFQNLVIAFGLIRDFIGNAAEAKIAAIEREAYIQRRGECVDFLVYLKAIQKARHENNE